MKKNLVLFDADFLLYYATMGNKVLDEAGLPIKENGKFVYTERSLEEVYYAADTIIQMILDKATASLYCGYLGNSKSFRHKIDTEYKANRKDMVKPKYFQELKDYLVSKWSFVLLDNGLEADDAVSIVRNRNKDTYNIFIATPDKDLIKCKAGKYINPKDFSIIRTSKDKAWEAFWTSMIVGDPSDNIKGIPRAGKKFAEKLFKGKKPEDYRELVRQAYITKYGLQQGNEECLKSFKLLAILNDYQHDFNDDIIEIKKEELGAEECEGDYEFFQN